MRELINWKKDFDLIDLGNIRCERIYDLLGLYDRAALVVTSDTATLHLGRGSNTRMICYVANGWGGSTKPQSCVCKIRYEQAATQQGIKRLNMFINSVLTTK
jgi:ADP-heptose:LPS heptosyltransferase